MHSITPQLLAITVQLIPAKTGKIKSIMLPCLCADKLLIVYTSFVIVQLLT